MDGAVAALRRDQILVTKITPQGRRLDGEERQGGKESPEEHRGVHSSVRRHD